VLDVRERPERAAARDRTGGRAGEALSVEDIAGRLDDRFRFLRVLGSLDPVSHGIAVNADPCHEVAMYMKTEILRIISELSEPFAP
jgi:hypothetical protein